jgi:hypothetical protein
MTSICWEDKKVYEENPIVTVVALTVAKSYMYFNIALEFLP